MLLSLSTQLISGKVFDKKKKKSTSKEIFFGIDYLNLSVLLNDILVLDKADCVDPHGRLREQVIQTCVYKIPHSLSSCVLGIKTIFGYCHQKKVLQRFQLPQV